MKKSSVYPPEIEKVIEPQPFEFKEQAKITFDKRQFLVRIPNNISKALKIKKGDYIEFYVSLPHPKGQDEEMQFRVSIKRGNE